MQTIGAQRWGMALMAVLVWVGVCLRATYRFRHSNSDGEAPLLVAFASQTGTAEALAKATVTQIKDLAGVDVSVKLSVLGSIKRSDLQSTRRLLLIISTTGQGAAPDNASQFVKRFMQGSQNLTHLEYALLGLGDRRYKQFCGFADSLDQWLSAQGASRISITLRSDRNDPRILTQWQQTIESIAHPRIEAADSPGGLSQTL